MLHIIAFGIYMFTNVLLYIHSIQKNVLFDDKRRGKNVYLTFMSCTIPILSKLNTINAKCFTIWNL